MQAPGWAIRTAVRKGAVLAMACVLAGQAHAGDYTAVEIGTTGLQLRNSAVPQKKHYLKQDADLLGRIACLMDDVDLLLCQLHALPPELIDSPALRQPVEDRLGEVYALALQHNPMLKPMRSELAVLAAQTRQAGAKQDPTLGIELMDFPTPLPLWEHIMESKVSISLSQMFEGYGKRKLKRRIASQAERLKEIELQQAELDLLFDVTEMYYELMDTKAQLRSLDNNIKLMGLLIELARQKYSVGREEQGAVLNAEVTLSEMQQMRTELGVLEEQQGVALAGMLGNPAGFDPASLSLPSAYPLPPSSDWDSKALLAQALPLRPETQRLDEEEKRQDLMVEMAHREYRPDYELMTSYSVGWAMEDMVSAGISIPLFTNKEDRQDARLQEEYAMLDVIRSQREVVSNDIYTKLRDRQLELKMHSQLAEMYRSALVPQARLALQSGIAGFSADMMDLSDLIMAQQNLLRQETELERNYLHILHTLADLQIISGGAFDPSPYLIASVDQPPPAASRINIPVPPAEPESASGLPRTEPSFVDQLGLPVPEAGPAAQPEAPGASDEPGESEPAEAPQDDFYKPYVPSGGKGGDK